MNKSVIAVFGANPAWQKTLVFNELRHGQVNRAAEISAFASGKGINFCRAAGCAGICRTRLYQFADGRNGEALNSFLEQEEGMEFVSIPSGSETRCCMTCIDRKSGEVTELIEPSGTVPREYTSALLKAWKEGLSSIQGAAITGTLPGKTDPGLYGEIARSALSKNIPLLVDAWQGVLPVLDESGKFILKINAEELCQLAEKPEIDSALKTLAARWPQAILAITDGPDEAHLAAEGRFWRFTLPPIRVVNPIGSGDTCSAVMLSNLLSGAEPQEAFSRGLAAASANCLDPQPGKFDPRQCNALIPVIREVHL